MWLLPFDGLERLFGYGGLALIAFVFAAAVNHPDWGALARGALPGFDLEQPALYLYFAVGLVATTISPYEVYFYSSGAVEDRWQPGDLWLNKLTAFVGFGLGALLSIALLVTSAELLQPRQIQPESLGSVALLAAGGGLPLLLLALLGMLFATGGAAVETSLAGAYTLAQFLGWQWGKSRGKIQAPRFSLTWVGLLLTAGVVLATGVDPVQVTEYAVIFAAVAMPLTYLPVLLVANDRRFMGDHANGRLGNALGWAYLAVIVIAAAAAVPLLIVTSAGRM
jgi:Mn2+/Fe2+ NRAMP family transporter